MRARQAADPTAHSGAARAAGAAGAVPVPASVEDRLDALAAATPTPAAGSAAALTVATAAALVAMVARRAPAHATARAGVAGRRADALRQMALDLADADAAAYAAVLATAAGQPQRAEALVAATETLVRIAETGARTAALAASLGKGAPSHLRADAHVAALLADAAVRAVTGLVRANTTRGRLDGRHLHRAQAHAKTAADGLASCLLVVP